MFQRSAPIETAIAPITVRGAPAGALVRSWTGRIDRARTRMSLAGIVLFELLGFAALTGNFALVLIVVLGLPRRSIQGAGL